MRRAMLDAAASLIAERGCSYREALAEIYEYLFVTSFVPTSAKRVARGFNLGDGPVLADIDGTRPQTPETPYPLGNSVPTFGLDFRSALAVFDTLLAYQPVHTGHTVTLEPLKGHEREATGSYYTPPTLVNTLLDHSLDVLLRTSGMQMAARKVSLAPTRCAEPDVPLLEGTSGKQEAVRKVSLAPTRFAEPDLPRILDPAVGTGHFLLAAARRIASHTENPIAEVMKKCIFGIDLNPLDLDLCKKALWLECGDPDLPYGFLDDNFICGDSVADVDPVDVFGLPFDLVLGNPPFLNAIETGLEASTRVRAGKRTPEVGGTADLAFRFLALATQWVTTHGYVAMVQPRAVLNAASMARFRRETRLKPRLLCPLSDPSLFDGAAVFVSLVVLGPDGPCLVSTDLEKWRAKEITGDNWFAMCSPSVESPMSPPDGEFEVVAGMTAGEAYDFRPFVVENEAGEGPKLVTTGLIEPGFLLWGQKPCRYLKRDFCRPRLALTSTAPPNLLRRVQRSRRPKVLVAGLCQRVEAYLDAAGECVGAVSTYCVFDSQDDLSRLEKLADFLNCPSVTERFRAELGANALGGGSITMTKAWLKSLLSRREQSDAQL